MWVIKNKKTRKILSIIIPFIFMPLTVAAGEFLFEEKKYLFISFVLAAMAVLLFITGFEEKKIGTRREVMVAVMTALCVLGRFIPFFKPITALTVITAIYLGGESGFLVGALAALLSNFYFGQGPWTPFQMLGWGLIGLFAGYLGRFLKKRWAMVVYGGISGVAFSMIMDVWTVVFLNSQPTAELFKAALITAIPHTILYCISNVIFLLVLATPFGEKLSRIKIKYGV